jgi:hypothetical protein
VDRSRSGGFQDQARMGLFVSLFGALWASGACGSCAGVPQAAAVFPRLTPAPEFADLGAVYGADAEESERGSPSVRWVPGSGTRRSFCLALWGPLGLWRLWFLCWGTTGGRCISMGCP